LGELYGRVVSLGISPEYFLDMMSFEEVAALLKADTERQRRVFERDRMQWFYTVVSQGSDKIKIPTDLVRFDWEKEEEKKPRKLTKKEFEAKAKEAEKYLKHG